MKNIILLMMILLFSMNSCHQSKPEDSVANHELDLKDYENAERLKNFLKKRILENTAVLNRNVKSSDLNYQNLEMDNPNFQDRVERVDIKETQLSLITMQYLNNLEELRKVNDIEGIYNLYEMYKREKSLYPDLVALSGVFDTLEFYKDDIQAKGSCAPSGRSVAYAAIGGAILGARVGFLFGSFLGPAGTALGTAGGAIVGGLLSAIVSVGVQSLACDVGNVGLDDVHEIPHEYLDLTDDLGYEGSAELRAYLLNQIILDKP